MSGTRNFRLPCLGLVLTAVLLLISGCSGEEMDSATGESAGQTPGREPATGYEVIQAMHERYSERWYETLVFEQEVVEYRASGTDSSVWYEAMKIPGRLRIDMNQPASGNGYIFRGDSLYVFADGALSVAQPTLHPLLLLGFDVYRADPSRTAARLDSAGFDLSSVSQASWQGRDVYVVGGGPGEVGKAQFWIDRERLVFVRMLQPVGEDASATSEVQFNNYEPLGDGWIAPEVLFFYNGTPTMTERYSNVQIDVPLDEALFSPGRALETEHWLSY